jgi:phosphatidylglycerol:prolipoprotein diacylglycerol transferase
MIFSTIVWGIDPTLLKMGPLEIRYYGLLFATGFYVGYLIANKSFKEQGISEKWLEKLFVYVGVATILGARLGHVFFYDWPYYSEHPAEILKIWRGGLASHGATVAILFAAWLYGRKIGKGMLWVMDEVVVPIAFAGFCIRLGNFFNSEIIGIPTSLPWGVVFENVDDIARHPAQLYEAVAYLTMFFIMRKVNWFSERKGRKFGFTILAIFTARFIIEFVKENQVSFEDGMFFNMGQLLSLPLIVYGAWLMIKAKKNHAE